MTTIMDAMATSIGLASVILLVLGIIGLLAYAFKIRNVYVLVLSLAVLIAGGVMLGVATDVIDIAWNGWDAAVPAETATE